LVIEKKPIHLADDITEILWEVALDTITLSLTLCLANDET